MTLVLVSLEGCTSLWEVSTPLYFTSMLCNIGCRAIPNTVLPACSSHSQVTRHDTGCYCRHPQHQCSHYHRCHVLLLFQVCTTNRLFLFSPCFVGGDLRKLEGILPILTMFSILGPKQYGGTKLLKVQIQNFLICVQVSKR